MNKSIFASGAVAGLVLAAGIGGMVSAQSAATETGLSEAQIIELALAEIPGEVQDVEQDRYRGKDVFEVEILTEDGVEMELYIAADTGEILKTKQDGACDKDRHRDKD